MVDLVAGIRSAMKDPEFSREIRYFTGKLKISVDGASTVAHFDDGHLIEVSDRDVSNDECVIIISGTADHFDSMLAQYPVPFFQCLQTTAIKHGLELTSTNETFAYLPALNRLVALLRSDRVRTAS